MEFEYWWLLALPLFFTLGWLAARVDINQLLTESTALPAAYFKGLNFLISDQHDKAIEAFIEAVQANAESMELHFALGSLFRRRGEVDRAIHLHLSLLERKELPEQQKQAVMAELAQDYLKAGLFDRAEELFTSLHDSRYKQTALRALLEIYIREREWNNAIKSAVDLERLSGISFRKEVAQFHCEIAMKAILEHDSHSARHALDMAIEADKRCARANVMLGDLEAANGNHKQAISFWKRVEFQQSEYLGLVAPKLLNSYKALGNLEEGIAVLKTYLQTYKLPSILNLVYETTLAEEGPASAEALAREELSRKPSLQTLDQFLRAQSQLEGANQQDALLMQQTVRYAIGNRSAHYCDQCGFRARNFHWQCPACNAWESLSPESKESAI